MAAFQGALLGDTPKSASSLISAISDGKHRIDGLHPSIVIDPRRLHLTLGVMALESSSERRSQAEGAQGLIKVAHTETDVSVENAQVRDV